MAVGITSFENYDALKDAIADWLARDDLAFRIPDFIRLAELRTQRRTKLRLRFTSKKLTSTLVADQDFIDLPTDLGEIRDFWITGITPERNISIVSMQKLNDVRANDTGGQPTAGSIVTNTLELGPQPDSNYAYVLTYYTAGITALSETNTSNWLLLNAPDCLLHGALYYAADYLGDKEMKAEKFQEWQSAADEVRIQEWHARLGGGMLRMRPDAFA